MASEDVVREAALYLEYFLEGLSECNVVGSYTVQFLDVQGFSEQLEASLASHLIRLVTNMKALLMRFDSSFLPYCNVEVQTELTELCSVCNCQSSFYGDFKTLPLQSTKPRFEEASIDKTYGASAIAQLFASNPLLHIKQEIPCLKNTTYAKTVQCNNKEIESTAVDSENLVSAASLKLKEQTSNADEKSNVSLPFPIEYDTTQHLEEEQGEILLDHMEDSDTASSEGLMYSVYTMSSCGSLQLVSRILSKTNMLKDNLIEPVEKAMIEINSLKEEFGSKETDTFILQGNNVQDNDSVDQEQRGMIPGSSECEGNSKVSNKTSRSPKLVDIKSSNEASAFGSVIADIVKLGPEDLESSTWCGICETELPSSRSLKTHVSRMHSKVRCCNTCNKTIKAEDMCDHVRECHSDLPYICNLCGQSLRSNGGFQRHMDIHKGVRGNTCEICGRTFSRTEYYRDHKRIHTGEKPYQCQTCKKTFSRSSNLHTHMRIHKREEERLTCNVCFKSFARTDKLKDHMIRHLQIKRYACRLCSKSYNEKRDLIKHIDKIHSNDTDCGTD